MDVTFLPFKAHTAVMDYALFIINNPDVKRLISEFKFFDQNNFGWTDAIDEEQWKFLNGTAMVVFSKSIHPMHLGLRDRVVGVLRPIYVEIQKWIDDHRYIETTDIEDCLYWSVEGLIDREKTANELVRDENLSIQSRFELACNYCFMYYIENLWNCMPESEKRRYFGKHSQKSKIIDFWIKWLTSGAKKDLLLSPDGDFDELCFTAYYTNSVALKSFLNFLTIEDKEHYLTKIAKEKCLIPRVMKFCLLEMDCVQKAEMFKKTPFKTLKCFLDFPWQNSFLVMALYLQPHLQKADFVHLIYFIIYERIIAEWKDCNYAELLTDFWLHSPDNLKKYVRNQDIFKVLNFILSHMISLGSVCTLDFQNFLKDFILPEETKKRYQKACRSC